MAQNSNWICLGPEIMSSNSLGSTPCQGALTPPPPLPRPAWQLQEVGTQWPGCRRQIRYHLPKPTADRCTKNTVALGCSRTRRNKGQAGSGTATFPPGRLPPGLEWVGNRTPLSCQSSAWGQARMCRFLRFDATIPLGQDGESCRRLSSLLEQVVPPRTGRLGRRG